MCGGGAEGREGGGKEEEFLQDGVLHLFMCHLAVCMHMCDCT